MRYEKAQLFVARSTPKRPQSPEQMQRERKISKWERDAKLKEIDTLIKKFRNNREFFSLVCRWRRDKIHLLERF